jgi:hypothetical protein
VGAPAAPASEASGTTERFDVLVASRLSHLSATLTVRIGGASTLDSVRGAPEDDDGGAAVSAASTPDCVDVGAVDGGADDASAVFVGEGSTDPASAVAAFGVVAVGASRPAPEATVEGAA